MRVIIIIIDAKTERKVKGKEKEEFRYINTTDVNRKKGIKRNIF